MIPIFGPSVILHIIWGKKLPPVFCIYSFRCAVLLAALASTARNSDAPLEINAPAIEVLKINETVDTVFSVYIDYCIQILITEKNTEYLLLLL